MAQSAKPTRPLAGQAALLSFRKGTGSRQLSCLPVTRPLGSFTSGVDGSSEGGRINTINLFGALVLYGVALLQALGPKNPKSKMSVAPLQVDGIWCLELSYEGDDPKGVPERWHGHQVVLRKIEPQPAPSG
jgi:hypothetical protein